MVGGERRSSGEKPREQERDMVWSWRKLKSQRGAKLQEMLIYLTVFISNFVATNGVEVYQRWVKGNGLFKRKGRAPGNSRGD